MLIFFIGCNTLWLQGVRSAMLFGKHKRNWLEFIWQLVSLANSVTTLAVHWIFVLASGVQRPFFFRQVWEMASLVTLRLSTFFFIVIIFNHWPSWTHVLLKRAVGNSAFALFFQINFFFQFSMCEKMVSLNNQFTTIHFDSLDSCQLAKPLNFRIYFSNHGRVSFTGLRSIKHNQFSLIFQRFRRKSLIIIKQWQGTHHSPFKHKFPLPAYNYK